MTIEREYKGTFLTQFEGNESYIAHLFNTAYKPYHPPMDAAENLTQMLKRIKADCENVLKNSYFDKNIHNQILKVLDDEETHTFCRFIAERRKSLKPSVATPVQAGMVKKAPSEKQLHLLKRLGSTSRPTTMFEASQEIDRLMKAKV
jgi:hypothetical protein